MKSRCWSLNINQGRSACSVSLEGSINVGEFGCLFMVYEGAEMNNAAIWLLDS